METTDEWVALHGYLMDSHLSDEEVEDFLLTYDQIMGLPTTVGEPVRVVV